MVDPHIVAGRQGLAGWARGGQGWFARFRLVSPGGWLDCRRAWPGDHPKRRAIDPSKDLLAESRVAGIRSDSRPAVMSQSLRRMVALRLGPRPPEGACALRTLDARALVGLAVRSTAPDGVRLASGGRRCWVGADPGEGWDSKMSGSAGSPAPHRIAARFGSASLRAGCRPSPARHSLKGCHSHADCTAG